MRKPAAPLFVDTLWPPEHRVQVDLFRTTVLLVVLCVEGLSPSPMAVLAAGDPMTTAIPPAVVPEPSVMLMFSNMKVLLELPPARLILMAPAPKEDEQF